MRPYTLSKKFSSEKLFVSIYVAILFNVQRPVFKDRRRPFRRTSGYYTTSAPPAQGGIFTFFQKREMATLMPIGCGHQTGQSDDREPTLRQAICTRRTTTTAPRISAETSLRAAVALAEPASRARKKSAARITGKYMNGTSAQKSERGKQEYARQQHA